MQNFNRSFFSLLFLFSTTWLFAQIPPPCPSNFFPPADNCSEACIYCNFIGLTSSTAGYTGGGVPGFCGTIENEQWLGFIAGCNSATFTATASNCTDGNGIQVAVMEACGQAPIACYGGQSGGAGVPASVTAGLVIGQNYFMMIDGFAGDQCIFDISVSPPQCVSLPPLGSLGAIAGETLFCQNTSEVYSVAPIANAGQYTWTSPPGSTINGQSPPVSISAANGGDQVTVTFGSSAVSGQVCVFASNACSTAPTVCKNVNPASSGCCNIATTITGTNCFTVATTKLTANPGTGYTYLWSTGQTTRIITVLPGIYCVTATETATGCTGTACFTACKKPVVSISPVGTVNICNGKCLPLEAMAGSTSTYQWGGGPATTNWTVCPSAATTVYSVTATNHAGCTATKSVTVKTVACNNNSGCAPPWGLPTSGEENEEILENEESERTAERDKWLENEASQENSTGNELVRAYPNPASRELILDYAEQLAEVESIVLFDLNGRKLLDVEIDDSGYSRVDVSALPVGVYFLKINGAFVLRVALAR